MYSFRFVGPFHLTRLIYCSLHKCPETLAQLREKLFILWGNLEEMKEKRMQQSVSGEGQDIGDANKVSKKDSLSSLPFACCIKEYGVRCKHKSLPDGLGCRNPDCFGWERRFAMFGTTIL